MILRNTQNKARKGQTTLEYALLIIAVAAAFIAMYRYLSGATGAKLHDIENELNPGVDIQP
ncbi:MAG: class III signal peptide-containing protein [Candidatus Omnitrophota bacterium]